MDPHDGHGHGHGHGHGDGHEGHGHGPGEPCRDGAHDHDASWERGAEYSLYRVIDTPHARAFNTADERHIPIFKPWEQRLDVSQFIESDTDDQLLLYIPFTASVTLKGIRLVGGRDGRYPASMKLFTNRDNIDFDLAQSLPPVQAWDLQEDYAANVEYATRISKFQGISSLTIFFPRARRADTVAVSYIGLKGDYTTLSRAPVVTAYEATANPADHKVKGAASATYSYIG